MRALAPCSLVVGFLVASSPALRAGDLRVPADYATIQAAINAASAGDTIHVASGTYYENIDFIGKDVVVISDSGPASTIIDGGGIDSVVKFLHGETPKAVLHGFTITNGYGYIGYCNCTSVGGGIVISEDLGTKTPSNPTIRRNVIVHNSAKDGGGIYSSFCEPRILGNVIASNSATNHGGGVWIGNASLGGGQPILSANTIVANSAGNGGGLEVDNGSAQVTNCILWSDTGGEIALENGASATVQFCDVAGGASGTRNIDSDPIFVDPTNGDFHLTVPSPCIDVGDDSDSSLSAQDIDGDWRILGLAVDIGADELMPAPKVFGVSPARTRYDVPTSVTISGSAFAVVSGIAVSVGGTSASNVVLVDDTTITCDVPGGLPGPADVVVSDSIGSGTLAGGFVYTPAVTIEGDTTIGSSITIHDLCDPGDGIFAVYGLPPAVSVATPPFDGDLAIVPFHYFFFVVAWPFDSFDLPATIPNDPALIGMDVLLQSLIGPALTKPPKDGSWTNCAVLSIK